MSGKNGQRIARNGFVFENHFSSLPRARAPRAARKTCPAGAGPRRPAPAAAPPFRRESARCRPPLPSTRTSFPGGMEALRQVRSEEHTSELQSQSNLVCRLLLEKKKKKTKTNK